MTRLSTEPGAPALVPKTLVPKPPRTFGTSSQLSALCSHGYQGSQGGCAADGVSLRDGEGRETR